MAKPKNTYERMARDAAQRLDQAREAGEQLTFLPDEAGSAVDLVQDRPIGRPEGAKGKVSNQMREWLAAKGLAMPEDMLAQMVGLASRDDAVLNAMQQAERVLAWAFAGQQRTKKGGTIEDVTPTGPQRLNTFIQLYTIQLRAADALLPYGAPKATPDVNVTQQTTVIVPSGAPAAPGDQAKVVNSGGRMAPPPLPGEIVENQQVSDAQDLRSDEESRTE